MNKTATIAVNRFQGVEAKPNVASKVATLQANGDKAASADYHVLLDLFNATPKLRVIVETYDPVTGFYRLAICGYVFD